MQTELNSYYTVRIQLLDEVCCLHIGQMDRNRSSSGSRWSGQGSSPHKSPPRWSEQGSSSPQESTRQMEQTKQLPLIGVHQAEAAEGADKAAAQSYSSRKSIQIECWSCPLNWQLSALMITCLLALSLSIDPSIPLSIYLCIHLAVDCKVNPIVETLSGTSQTFHHFTELSSLHRSYLLQGRQLPRTHHKQVGRNVHSQPSSTIFSSRQIYILQL